MCLFSSPSGIKGTLSSAVIIDQLLDWKDLHRIEVMRRVSTGGSCALPLLVDFLSNFHWAGTGGKQHRVSSDSTTEAGSTCDGQEQSDQPNAADGFVANVERESEEGSQGAGGAGRGQI